MIWTIVHAHRGRVHQRTVYYRRRYPVSLALPSIAYIAFATVPDFLNFLVVRTTLAPVPNDLEAANHLANSEEAKDFCRNDTYRYECGGVKVAQLAHQLLRVP